MNILIFGDSITQGFYDIEMGGWEHRLFIHVMKKMKENKSVDLRSSLWDVLDGGIHPNSKGHELIFETVKDFLKKIT